MLWDLRQHESYLSFLASVKSGEFQGTGEAVRIYPFKIVSGLYYQTNKGSRPLGTNLGIVTKLTDDNYVESVGSGNFTSVNLIHNGNDPIISYWFGVKNSVVSEDTNGFQKISETIQLDENLEPVEFTNPFDSNRSVRPWKDCFIINFNISTNASPTSKELDNQEVALIDQSVSLSVASQSWYPSLQEINEFLYVILDPQAFSPIFLKIQTVEPHINPETKQFQYCDISFVSVNDYFSQTGKTILNYVRLGEVGDAYAFPKEFFDSQNNLRTTVNENFTQKFTIGNETGITNMQVQNNSLTAPVSIEVWGRPFEEFQKTTNADGSTTLSRQLGASRLLFIQESGFLTPEFDSNNPMGTTTENYSFWNSALVINQQIYKDWSTTKEYYNPNTAWTFEGGIAFYSSSNPLFKTYQNLTGFEAPRLQIGTQSIEQLNATNPQNYPLSSNKGFTIPWGLYTIDARGNPLFGAVLFFTDILKLNYAPVVSDITNPFSYFSNIPVATVSASRILNMNLFSTMFMEKLPITYRQGITFTSDNSNKLGVFGFLQDIMGGIKNWLQGYDDGWNVFHLETSAQSINLLLPTELINIVGQYMNPTNGIYNAVPFDIFQNNYERNTAVGQLTYSSGFRFKLTDEYKTKDGSLYNSLSIGQDKLNTGETPTNINAVIGGVSGSFLSTSLSNFDTANISGNGKGYIIDQVNYKHIGKSNLQIKYFANNATTDDNSIENQREWIQNNAKVRDNALFWSNRFMYYTYDQFNTSIETNINSYPQVSPLPPAPSSVPSAPVIDDGPLYTNSIARKTYKYGLSCWLNDSIWKTKTSNLGSSVPVSWTVEYDRSSGCQILTTDSRFSYAWIIFPKPFLGYGTVAKVLEALANDYYDIDFLVVETPSGNLNNYDIPTYFCQNDATIPTLVDAKKFTYTKNPFNSYDNVTNIAQEPIGNGQFFWRVNSAILTFDQNRQAPTSDTTVFQREYKILGLNPLNTQDDNSIWVLFRKNAINVNE